MSEINNQIITLSASSPHNLLSGCKLYSKNINPKPPLDISTPKPLPEHDSTYFDQFIKTTTEPVTYSDQINSTYDFGSELFNYTDYNATDIFNSSDFVKIPYSHDMAFENDLENGTEFINDVEELFASTNDDDSDNRMRRDVGLNGFKKENRGTVMVTCSNVGGFTSSRERWWYIAIANCRSNKGLDIKYRFRMTNGPFGDFWHEHFSADEMCTYF